MSPEPEPDRDALMDYAFPGMSDEGVDLTIGSDDDFFIEFEDALQVLRSHVDAERQVGRAELEAWKAKPCGSCHPCLNWADETWRRAGRRPPAVSTWDDTLERFAEVRAELARLRRAALEIDAMVEHVAHDCSEERCGWCGRCDFCGEVYPCAEARLRAVLGGSVGEQEATP